LTGSRLLAAQVAIYAAAMIGVVTSAVLGHGHPELIAGPAMLWYDVLALVLGIRASRHPGLDRRTRRFSWVITGALGLTLTISLTFTVTGTEAFPQVGDALHIAAMAVVFAGLMLAPVRAATRHERWKTLLDSGTVVAGASMLLWYLVIGPSLVNQRASVALILAAACYPLVDLLVLFALARVLLRGTGHVSRRALAMLGGAALAILAGDIRLGYAQAHVAVVERAAFDFAVWLTTHFLLACAAVELWRQAARPFREAGTTRRVAGRLPYLGIGLGYGLLAAAAVREDGVFPWGGLILGAATITGSVVLRQLVVQKEITEAAETDPLTGLANRARLQYELSRALRRAARGGGGVAVLLVDLNGFKQINDTRGHQVGDRLLVAVATAMRDAVRESDLVSRLGGDEFAVLVYPVTDPATVGTVAEKVNQAIAGPFVVAGQPMNASASIGVAAGEPGELSPDALLHRADMAMYDVKRRDGSRVRQPGLTAAGNGLEEDLARAVEAGELRMSYHPVRSLAGGLVGVDATLSWEHPNRGTIVPEVFLPIAERIGVDGRIGAWALDRAVDETARHNGEHGAGRYVVVRAAPRHLRRPGFVAEVGDLLATHGLAAHDLVLDVPGHTGREPEVAARLGALRALGVRVAVHDLRIGDAALRTVPMDLLRTDPAWDHPAAEAVIRLGQALGLATLAGDVEVPADATDLRGLFEAGDPQRLRH
jgi:diguanylate cyclase (GGDEF)-like protein